MLSGRRPPRGILHLLPVLLFLFPGAASARPGHPHNARLFPFAESVCSVRSEAPGRPTASENCAGLDTLVAGARESLVGAKTPTETVDLLNGFFFREEKFQVTYDLSTPAHLLPGPVLAGRKGYCVGLAAVYLMLTEELGLPVHTVATPKHVFLRWDDGTVRRNIELFQNGRSVPDEDYIREQKIPQESIEHGVFLANLTRMEFLAFIYQNLGVLESQKGNFEASARYYAKALHLNPKLAAAYYNQGNDELKQKRYRKAIRDYTKGLKLYPTDAWALHNRGLAWKGLGKMEEAKKDWKRAREIDPSIAEPERSGDSRGGRGGEISEEEEFLVFRSEG